MCVERCCQCFAIVCEAWAVARATPGATPLRSRCTAPMLLPLELVDSFIGKRVYVVTKQDKELEATLTGVDAYVNLVLKDVWEL